MIGFLPEFYEDETFYSLVARYYLRSGLPSYKDVMEALYDNAYYRSDPLFYNKLRPEITDLIALNKPLKEVIEKHTLFPYYARFLPLERRKKALESLEYMTGQYHNLLPLSGQNTVQRLRYCPVCADKDRQRYGETYYHRIHQLWGVDICSIHGCLLIEIDVFTAVKKTAGIVPCDIVVANTTSEPKMVEEPRVKEVADYIVKVFNAEMDYEADGIGSFLRRRINEKYLSVTGLTVDIMGLYKAYREYFCVAVRTLSYEQFNKVLNGYRVTSFDVCQVAMMLGIPVEDLISFRLAKEDVMATTIEKLAKKYDLESEIVADIVSTTIKEFYNKTTTRRSSHQRKRWDDLDEKLLPRVKEILENANSSENERPIRITYNWVCKQIGITTKQLDKLTCCKQAIKFYAEAETTEHFWAREVIWAYKCLEKKGTEICWRRIRELINIRKNNFEDALPHIKKMTDERTYEKIAVLL